MKQTIKKSKQFIGIYQLIYFVNIILLENLQVRLWEKKRRKRTLSDQIQRINPNQIYKQFKTKNQQRIKQKETIEQNQSSKMMFVIRISTLQSIFAIKYIPIARRIIIKQINQIMKRQAVLIVLILVFQTAYTYTTLDAVAADCGGTRNACYTNKPSTANVSNLLSPMSWNPSQTGNYTLSTFWIYLDSSASLNIFCSNSNGTTRGYYVMSYTYNSTKYYLCQNYPITTAMCCAGTDNFTCSGGCPAGTGNNYDCCN